MTLAYFDPSALVQLVVEEEGSHEVALLWDGADAVVTSRVAHPEVRAALAAAHRDQRLDGTGHNAAKQGWRALHSALRRVAVPAALEARAGGLAETHALSGFDAIHLATALTLADAPVILATGDRRLRKAARTLGLATLPSGDAPAPRLPRGAVAAVVQALPGARCSGEVGRDDVGGVAVEGAAGTVVAAGLAGGWRAGRGPARHADGSPRAVRSSASRGDPCEAFGRRTWTAGVWSRNRSSTQVTGEPGEHDQLQRDGGHGETSGFEIAGVQRRMRASDVLQGFEVVVCATVEPQPQLIGVGLAGS